MRRLYAVLGWLFAALAATGVGVAALGALGTGIVGEAARPLSQQDVERELARVSATASPSPSPSASPSGLATPVSGPVVLAGAGGTVTARCYADGKAGLDSWSPRQGYQVEDVERGPARAAEIQFETGDSEVKGKIRCVSGRPVARWSQDD